jgi:hypothetical protein
LWYLQIIEGGKVVAGITGAVEMVMGLGIGFG